MNTNILLCVFAFLATSAFAFLFGTPKKIVPLCGLTGAIAWYVCKCMGNAGYIPFVAVFMASLVATVVAGFFAGLMQKPLAVFVSSGIIPLVPGMKLYDGICALVQNNFDEGTKLLTSAAIIAVAITIGVMLGTSIFYATIKWKLRDVTQKK